MTADTIANQEYVRIKKIVSPIALEASKHMRVTCPLPVWDSTGTMIGVSIAMPILMGGKPCETTATFAVKFGADHSVIASKAHAAVAAMMGEVQVMIRPAARKIA